MKILKELIKKIKAKDWYDRQEEERAENDKIREAFNVIEIDLPPTTSDYGWNITASGSSSTTFVDTPTGMKNSSVEVPRAPLYYELDSENKVVLSTHIGIRTPQSLVKPGLWRHELCKNKKGIPKVAVITSFLSIDHGHIQPPGVIGYRPVVFETVIFAEGKKYKDVNNYRKRYCTYDEAYMGHRTAVRAVRKRYEK